MKTFDKIYEELKNSDNDGINEAWMKAKEEKEKVQKTCGIICAIVDIVIISITILGSIGINNMSSQIGPLSIMPILFGLMFIGIIDVFIIVIPLAIVSASKNSKELHTKYKDVIIKKLISNFYDNLEYYPYKQMPEYIYKQQKYEYYDIYKSDDYIEAQINNKYSIQMGEVHTIDEREYKDKDGNVQKEYITLFHGLFAKIVMDKSINSELKIMQDGAALFSKEKLKMDSTEFEKYFDVKASNPIIGMQLLTADVMQELVEFENKTKMKYDVAIKNNEIYLRFHSGPMFEVGNIKNGVFDENTLKKYFYMLNFTYNLSNMLINLVNDTEI